MCGFEAMLLLNGRSWTMRRIKSEKQIVDAESVHSSIMILPPNHFSCTITQHQHFTSLDSFILGSITSSHY